MIGWLSKLLSKFGLTEYLSRVEFACHIFCGATFALIGTLLISCDTVLWRCWLGNGIVVAYSIYMLYDELVVDGHYRILFGGDPEWRDFLWDIGSKLAGPAVYGIIRIC